MYASINKTMTGKQLKRELFSINNRVYHEGNYKVVLRIERK